MVLGDGRRIGYAVYGHPDGRPAFYFHGLPGSRYEGAMLDRACRDAGVCLIAPDRPGYGWSDPLTGSRLETWPHRVAEFADRLGIGRFHLFALSGGAPYALACASVLQERVIGTGICCGLGDLSQPGLLSGMSLNARLAFGLVHLHPAWLQYSYGPVLTSFATLVPGFSIRMLAWLEGRVDREVLQQPEVRCLFAANLHEAFRQGAGGGVADMVAALGPWPFDLGRVGCLHQWHGTQDPVVPIRHSEWLMARVPDASLIRVEGEGHFSLPVRHGDRMVETVLGNCIT